MILVTGSTGNVGRELVPLLVQRDLDVRCLVHAGGVALRTADAEVGEVDEHLRASGLGVTLLRPTAFMQVHLVPPGGAADGRWYGASGDDEPTRSRS